MQLEPLPSLNTTSRPGLDGGAAAGGSKPPAHLIRLREGPWALWRWAALRGAGFPSRELYKLSAPECAAAADQLLLAEEETERARDEALKVVREALDALKLGGGWDDQERRNFLLTALRDLKKGKVASALASEPEFAAPAEALRGAGLRVASASDTFRRAFAAAAAETSRAIQDIARLERFREAVTWQNHHAFQTAVCNLSQEPGAAARGARQRQHEELIASYFQRYSAKNDTIGFFGPVGWSKLVAEGKTISVRPGPGLVTARKVYFEAWGISLLADKLNELKELRPWVAPRQTPYIYVDGNSALLPSGRSVPLDAREAALLKACDGERTAEQIAQELSRHSIPGGKAEVYERLEGLRRKGLIIWALEVGSEPFAERLLWRQLNRIEDESLRRRALDPLQELERRRDLVADAAGDAEKLGRAISELGKTFTEMTGAPATRAAGQTYAARTLVYEDCRRDVDVEIGQEILRSLDAPLSLMLRSARWITHRVAELYRAVFREVYHELARKSGPAPVDLATFWQKAQPLIFNKDKSHFKSVRGEFQQRWAGILSLPAGRRSVHYASDELRPRVEAAFDAPRPGWTFARYHSPDIMIAAASVEAIRRDDYQLVMGEFHVGTNTLRASLFVAQHPSAEDLVHAVEQDIPQPRVVPVPPKLWHDTARTRPALVSARDLLLLSSPDTFSPSKERALPIGALLVEEAGGELLVRTRDGSARFDIVEIFAEVLSLQTIDCFRMMAHAGHSPRVSIDRLVISRESWSFPLSEVRFLHEKDAAERFVAARRWARAYGMPRFAFAKTPAERKPFYVDFDSPMYVNLLAKALRRADAAGHQDDAVVVSEMLPTHEQLWLHDAEGQRYTSEVRIVAVDLDA